VGVGCGVWGESIKIISCLGVSCLGVSCLGVSCLLSPVS
jgi:hypothetical protein